MIATFLCYHLDGVVFRLRYIRTTAVRRSEIAPKPTVALVFIRRRDRAVGAIGRLRILLQQLIKRFPRLDLLPLGLPLPETASSE